MLLLGICCGGLENVIYIYICIHVELKWLLGLDRENQTIIEPHHFAVMN